MANHRRSGPCLLWRGFDKSRHIVPNTLLVIEQCFRRGLNTAVEGPSTRDGYWVILSTSKPLSIFKPDDTKVVANLAVLSSRPGERILRKHSSNNISPNVDKSLEYGLKNFPFFRSLWYLWPCVNGFWSDLKIFSQKRWYCCRALYPP